MTCYCPSSPRLPALPCTVAFGLVNSTSYKRNTIVRWLHNSTAILIFYQAPKWKQLHQCNSGRTDHKVCAIFAVFASIKQAFYISRCAGHLDKTRISRTTHASSMTARLSGTNYLSL